MVGTDGNNNDRTQAQAAAVLDRPDDEFAFWPLNLVLIILGGTILGVSFIYLDPVDDRLLYNPWTYVVVTPLCLMMTSLVLSKVVSRIVEKSMQMAFLLSVLVHLFLIIGAMNVVIFSRLWPEIIESMARERDNLRRQSLQAPQYHRVNARSRSEARPDYLRHVPTEHSPTEMAKEMSPALSMARSSVEHLVTPQPRREAEANPHTLERQQPSPSMASKQQQAASLSRSQLDQQSPPKSQPENMYLLAEPETQNALSASNTNDARSVRELNNMAVSLEDVMVEPEVPRMATNASAISRSDLSQPSPSQVAQQYTPQAMARAARMDQPNRAAEIPVPETQLAEVATNELRAAVSSRSRAQRVNSTSKTLVEPTTLNATLVPDSQAVRSLTAPDVRRREMQRTVPDASMGDFRESIARETAGGRPGSAAPSSMPVQGVEGIGASELAPMELATSAATEMRRSDRGRQTGSAPQLGSQNAPTWNSSPSLSAGISGQSPTQLAQASIGGTASSADVADLGGVGKTMQRSMAALPGLAGALAGPSAPDAAGAAGASSEASENLHASDSARHGQRLSQSSSAAVLSSPTAPQTEQLEALVSGIAELPARAIANSPESSLTQERGVRQDLERSRANASLPQSRTIEMPNVGLASAAEDGQQAPASSTALNVKRATGWRDLPNENLLAIEAPEGSGGLAPTMNVGGSLLPRTTDLAQDIRPMDLEIQRFERQSVGGPLASGQIAIPKPAFQQRIDRLQDDSPANRAAAEPQTELAIERGLEFLAKHQREDGSWQLQDFDTEVLMTSDTAATGLALLAFQGAGYTHKNFKYAEVCDKAIQFLRQNQQANGDLYIRQNPATDQNAWLYSHGIAAIAMCEAYGMTQDPEIKGDAQLAVDFIETSQDPSRGGWRYRPGVGSDTSVSGWFMMALQSAQLAGLDVNPVTLERLADYLEASASPDGQSHLYRYNPYAADTAQQRHGLKPTPVMTSVGLLMRLYTGWDVERDEMQAGTNYLLQHLPAHGTSDSSKRDTYYWYYATQVMFHMGGDTWEQWHDALYPLLIASQVTEGPYEGSWDPIQPTPDLWSRYGGRLYVTTMNLLSLEITYRHLPIYDASASPRVSAIRP